MEQTVMGRFDGFRLQRPGKIKISLCLLFVLAGAALFNSGHAIDSFVPKHMAVGYETAVTGGLPENHLVDQIPGFYSLVAILIHVLDINALALLHFPIQILPYSLGFFALAYLVTDGNYMFAGLLAGLELLLNSSGTLRMFLWPHGLGFILFFTLSIGLLVLFRRESTLRIFPLMLLCSAALVYISYNLTAIFLFVLVTGYVLLETQGIKLHEYVAMEDGLARSGVKYAMLVTAVVMGTLVWFSEFFQDTFMPLVSSGFDTGTLSGFLAVWIAGNTGGTSLISHLQSTPPDLIRYIAMFRYILVAIALTLFAAYLLSKLRTNLPVVSIELLLLTYICSLAIYFVARLYIGSIAVALFYLPGVLSIAYLYSHVDDYLTPYVADRRISAAILLMLLLIGGSIVVGQAVSNQYGQIDRNLEVPYHADNEQVWIDQHTTPDQETFSPELNRNSLILQSMMAQEAPSYRQTSEKFELMEETQAAALTTYQDPVGEPTFALNGREQSMSLQNWQVIESWQHHVGEINDNPNVDKVYTEGEAWVYTG